MRIIKASILTLLGLIALLVLAVVVITATIDPNDYKTDIESAVGQHTTLTLTIDGDLGWSFIPLGIDVNNVTLKHSDGNTFTQLNQLSAQVGFLSLLKLSPQVHKVILDGLEVTLEKNEQGEANWDNITHKNEALPSSNSSESPDPSVSDTDTQQSSENKTKSQLNLEVEEVAITNTTIHYTDKQTNQSVSLKDFNLLANNITLGNEFPLDIQFSISNSRPQLDVDAKINAAIKIDKNMNVFEVNKLQSNYQLAGEVFNNKSVSASMNADTLLADLTKDTVSLNQFAVAFSNLALQADIEIQNLSEQPQLKGSLTVPDFSLQSLLASLGLPKIDTADPKVLQKLGFSTQLQGSAEDLQLNGINLKLDDTDYTGSLNYKSAGQFIATNITGTELNVDRYLPAPVDPVTQAIDTATGDKTKESTGSTESKSAQATSQPEAQLLPLETIRSLNFDISVIQQKLIAKNLKLNDLTLLANAKNGVITLTKLSGNLYEGNFDVNAIIDAKSDNPKWSINKTISNIQVMPLLKDFQNLDVISGGVNLKADIKTTGNTVSAIRNAAKGNAKFSFEQGALHGFNLTKLACEGFALINQDKVTKSDWGNTTDFQAMNGQLTIDGNTFTNNKLTAAMSGLALVGKGVIDAKSLSINYGVDLKAIGDLGDNACRVNEKIKGLAIPVLCKGSLEGDPAKLCKLDSSRLKDLVAAAGKKELKRKAEKEVDKQLKKYLNDDKPGAAKDVKKLIKGLF